MTWEEPHKRRRRPEAKVQKEIVAWLRAHGAVCAITDAGDSFGAKVPTGWPDITCCLPDGRFLGVECKSAKGKQTPAQLAIQAKIENISGVYLLAHSFAEFMQEFFDLGLSHRDS
jgi:hypothetical protein